MSLTDIFNEVRGRGYSCCEKTIRRKLKAAGVRSGGLARATRYDAAGAMEMVNRVFPILSEAPRPRRERKRGRLVTVEEAMAKGGRS